jgi:hypothetical protein
VTRGAERVKRVAERATRGACHTTRGACHEVSDASNVTLKALNRAQNHSLNRSGQRDVFITR